MKLCSLGAGAAAALAVLAASPAALANGRYPAAGQIAIDPVDPDHMLIRATYGILSTTDGGKHWSWICEAAVGFGDYEDPMLGITKDGSVLAGIFTGLNVTHDGGCQWNFIGGGLEKHFAIDLAVERQDPSSAVTLISNSITKDTFLTQVWQSPDNAKTWTQAGADIPSEFLGLTLDSAPSDPQRIYVSGRLGSPDYLGALQRSKDRGQTWEKLLIPGSDGVHLPYIGGIDPNDPAVLYVRLDGDMADALLVSKDGGDTFSTAWNATSLLGFALSPDGSMIAAGGDPDGLWTAPTSTLAFTKVSDVHVRCLTWTPQGLFACADEFKDGFSAGVSADGGKTFSAIMHLQELCGPLDCDPQSSVGKVCPMLWGATKLSIGGASCDGDAGPSSGASTGAGGAGGAGNSGGGGADSGGGCACGAPRETSAELAGSLATAGFALLLGRRRRQVKASWRRS